MAKELAGGCCSALCSECVLQCVVKASGPCAVVGIHGTEAELRLELGRLSAELFRNVLSENLLEGFHVVVAALGLRFYQMVGGVGRGTSFSICVGAWLT